MTETLRFDLLANDRASGVFDKVGRSAADTESRFSKVSKGLGAVGKAAAFGLAGGVAIGAVALGKFVGEARESEKVGKLTESIIKSTGGAAKITAAQVGNLSTSLSNKTGMDDEAIQSGSNLLLTFKNVRNEAGKGNDVFNQATAAALDLSAAGFGSIESGSKMLGKALNDPIKGITALSRAGVTFTQQQQDQIKAMTESGDALGAQKIILGEVQSQVGGAAAATGTATEKMQVSLGNLGESIGTSLLPLVDKGATIGAKFVGGLTTAFQSGGLQGAFSYVANGVTAFVPVLVGKLGEWATAFVGWIGPMIPVALTKLGELGFALLQWLINTGYPLLVTSLAKWGRAFVEWIGPMISPALSALGAGAGRVFDWLLSTGLPRLLSNLRKWGTALVEWIAPMIPPVLAEIAKLAAKLVGWIVTDGSPKLVAALGKLAVELVEWIGPMIPKAVVELGKLGAQLVGWVVGEGIPTLTAKMLTMGIKALESLKDGAVDGFQSMLTWLGGLGVKIVSGIGSMSSLLVGVGKDLVQGFINGMKSMLGSVIDAAGNLASSAINAIKDKAKIFSPSRATYALGEFFSEGMAGGIKNKAKAVADAAGELAKKATDRLKDLRSQAASIADGITSSMRGALDVGSLGGPMSSSKPSDLDLQKQEIAVTRARDRVNNPSEGASGLDNQEAAIALQEAEATLAQMRADAASGNASVTDQLSNFASQTGVFAQALATAAANGLNGDLIERVAQMGPLQGLSAAQALAAMDASQVASANNSLAAVDKYANRLANTVLSTTGLPEDIARQQAILEALLEIKKDAGAAREINFVINDAIDPDRVVEAIRKYVRRNGKLRGVSKDDD